MKMEALGSVATASFLEKTIFQCSEDNLPVVFLQGRQFATASFLEKTIVQCSEDNLPLLIFLRRQLSTALFLEKTIVHCTEDNCPLLRRQFYSAKKTMWQWSFLEKTILPKKTILPLFFRRSQHFCSDRC